MTGFVKQLGRKDSNLRMQGSKPCALPLGDYPRIGQGWVLGFEPRISRATIWRPNQLDHTHHIREE